MFYQRVVFRPALGKVNELRSLLADRVRADQERVTTILTERILGKGQGFTVGIWHENLEAYEKERQYLRNDSTFREHAAKVSTLVSESRDIQLYRYITERPAGSPPANYIHLVKFVASGNKEAEVQAALEKFAEARASEGAVAPIIWKRVFSPDGNIFVAANRYDNLTEYENITTNRPASIRQLIEETADIITETPVHALFVPVVSVQR